MALEIGRHEVRITSNSIGTFGDKDAVVLQFETASGDEGRVLIFLTPKAMGIARASLKLAGFDCDTQSLTELLTNPELLTDKMIPVLVEDWNGKMRAQIALRSAPEVKTVNRYQDMLRKAKKSDDAVAEDDLPF